MKSKLLSIVFLIFVAFYSCNKNVETYHGQEAEEIFMNISETGKTVTYQSSDGRLHWLTVNVSTKTKYEYSRIDEIASRKTDFMKITRNCNVEKEMAIMTRIEELSGDTYNKGFLIIDNINDIFK